MFLRLNSSMAGTLPNGMTYDLQVNDVVDWHDLAEAERMIQAGRAEEVSSPRAAEMLAAGARVKKHPMMPFTKKK
jgi:hypothetical protein